MKMSNQNFIIEPSFLAFDKTNFCAQLSTLKELGIKRIHYDIMDSTYVPNFSFGVEYLQTIKDYGFEIEVHLMVNDVLSWYKKIEPFAPITILFHPCVLNKKEVEIILRKQEIHPDIKIGLAFDINENFLDYVDLLSLTKINLIMGVKAGAGGQSILQVGIDKLKEFKQYLTKNNLNLPIVFDGGINDQTINLVKKEANIIVSGSYLMKNSNIKTAYEKLFE